MSDQQRGCKPRDAELSDLYVGEKYESDIRTDIRSENPTLRDKLYHWVRFYNTYKKPCGCSFWCDRRRTHPENYEETEVLGSRTIIEEKLVYTNRVEDRTKEVAVCRCTRCGERFEAYIPHTKWAHNYVPEDDHPDEDVEGEWPKVTR